MHAANCFAHLVLNTSDCSLCPPVYGVSILDSFWRFKGYYLSACTALSECLWEVELGVFFSTLFEEQCTKLKQPYSAKLSKEL